MATINSVHLVGRLARDPLINKGENWTNAMITVCTTDKFKTRGGEDKEVTVFTPLTLWNDEAILAEKYLKKGVAVSIQGRLKEDRWIDKTTQLERVKLGVQVLTIMYLEKLEPLKEEVGQRTLIQPPSEEDGVEELPF